MPNYSAEWDQGDYRANNDTRNRMGFGGTEHGGEQYSSRSRMLGSEAQQRGAYVSDMGQSNESRGYQTDALDLLHGAAAGTAPSQAAILARTQGNAATAANTSMAGSVKGGPGARVAAMRAAMSGNAMQQQAIAAQGAAARAGEMATARGQFSQAGTAMRAGDLDAARVQQQNELFQRSQNDAQQRFFETQGTGIQTQDQNNQLAQQQTASNNWAAGRAATMADEGFGFGKDMTYVGMGAGAAQGGISGAMGAAGGGKPDDDKFGSDERMKNIMPMTGAAPATFDKLSPSGGLDVTGSLKAHSDFATRFQSDPSGGMMMSPREAKNVVSLDDAMQRSFDGRGEPGVNYGYLSDATAHDVDRGVAGAPKGYAAERAGQPGSMFAPPPDAGYVSKSAQDDWDRYGAGSATDGPVDWKHGGATHPDGGDRRGNILAGVLGGLSPRRVMVSDDKTKLKAAFEEGARYADADHAGKPIKAPAYAIEKPAAAAPRPAPAPEPQQQSAPEPDALHRAAANPTMQSIAHGVVNGFGGFGLAGAATGWDLGNEYVRSDEQAKNVVDLDAGTDRSTMRDGSSDPRTHSFDKTFHRDSPADQKRVKRGVEDKASKDADAMMAGFGKSLEQGPTAKKDDGYVPDMAMFAAMKSMKPEIYSYKPEFTPPEQQTGELQAGPMANNMARSPVASMTLVKDPETGLLAIDKDKALKLTMGGLATLAEDLEDLKRKKGAR